MAGDSEVHSSLIAWHNPMLGERIFGPLWAIQIILDLLGQYGLFWTTYGPKIWIPNLAFKILYAKKLNIGLKLTFHGPSFVYFCTNQNGVFDPYLQTVTLYCLVLSPTDVQQTEVLPQQLGGILIPR